MHDFGAFKSAGFEVQEMGEAGEGSLEPGVASGDIFWVAYQQPFLKYYYAAHPDRLPGGHPDKPNVELEPATEAGPCRGSKMAAVNGFPLLEGRGRSFGRISGGLGTRHG